MTKPSRLRMNLQYFAEGDPVEPIAPTDPPEPVEPSEPIKPTEPQESFLEIKYNKEQLKLDKEKAAELAQKGMNYDKAVERAKQEARDTYIAEQGYEWNGRKITTEADYKKALREQEMQDKGLDPSMVDEYVENNPTVQWAKEFKSQQEAKEFADNHKLEFLEHFKEANGRDYDPAKDSLPEDVWAESEKYEASKGKEGKSLIDSYTRYENQSLKQKLAELEESKKIDAKNEENAQSSTGSISNGGGEQKAHFTREQVAKMSTEEVNKNWAAINQSMKKWE
jgi:hypothetical protein